ncbi:MAG: phospho-N-acetylmuramoyl-pentapeptide-transferase [Actinobacteria bacterium]|nr:phospho-N-acetylmuramoyl-pentapeptide-transferase [Actinomycetota bacterium]
MYPVRYPTYQVFLTAVLALVATVVLTPVWIELLKRRNVGQVVRVDGPQKHLVKAGTPTMGGVLIIGVVTAVYFLLSRRDVSGLIALFALLASGVIGLVDDYRKVVKERSLGLRARSKLLWQFAISAVIGLAVVNIANIPANIAVPGTRFAIPLGSPAFSFTLFGAEIVVPILYVAFIYLVFISATNTVNLTDGLDGLAAGTVTITVLAYAGIAFRQNHLELAVLSAAVAGACIGFLWYNCYPADIFMGDTGSLALGGVIATLAILTRTELLLILIGGIYVIEGLSVIAQIISFRWFGTRLLKMAPIHHHFELKGWSETQVMVRFWVVTGVLAGAGFALFFMTGPK